VIFIYLLLSKGEEERGSLMPGGWTSKTGERREGNKCAKVGINDEEISHRVFNMPHSRTYEFVNVHAVL